jgi:hypothetical protein
MDNTKVRGIFFNEPRDKAPDFVDGDVNIKVKDFIEFLKEQGNDYVKLDILRGRDGSRYLKLNTFKPEGRTSNNQPATNNASTQATGSQPYDDDVPFIEMEII